MSPVVCDQLRLGAQSHPKLPLGSAKGRAAEVPTELWGAQLPASGPGCETKTLNREEGSRESDQESFSGEGVPNSTRTRRLTSGELQGWLKGLSGLWRRSWDPSAREDPSYRLPYLSAARREKVLTIPEGEENRTPGCFLSKTTPPLSSRQCPSLPCPETSTGSHRTQTFCFSLFCLFPPFWRQIRAVQFSFGSYRLTKFLCVGRPRMVLAVG